MIDTTSARFHAAVALLAVAMTGALAAANHRRWQNNDVPPPVVETPAEPQATAITDTAAAPSSTCDSTLAELRQGRLGPFANSNVPELVVSATDSDTIWPGRRLVIVHAQRDGGNHPPSRTLVAGCDGDAARMFFEAAGRPVATDGATLTIEKDHLLDNDSTCCPSLEVTRKIIVSGDQWLESEPQVQLARNGRANITDPGIVAQFAGRYELHAVAGALGEAPMEAFVLQPDGFYFARRGIDHEPPYAAGSFEFGTWFPLLGDGPTKIVLAPVNAGEHTLTTHAEPNELVLDTPGGIFSFGPPGHPRSYWKHGAGHFAQQGPREWVEQSTGGTFTFVEQTRTHDYVELYDASRQCAVRLTTTECLVRCANFDWTSFYRGSWSAFEGE